jgi:catechol 2,3-dioxygenase-like lactoylglutathione lyase family enzyme
MKFYHLGIKAKDVNQSLHFYCDILGLKIIETVVIMEKKFYFVGNESFQIEIEGGNPGDTQANAGTMTGLNHLSLVVEDIQSLAKRFNENGVKLLFEPLQPRPDRWTTFVQDPDGVLIQLIQYV